MRLAAAATEDAAAIASAAPAVALGKDKDGGSERPGAEEHLERTLLPPLRC